MIMSDSLKKIAYWALVLTLIVAEIGSFFDLLNINPWCYPVYPALLILYNKFSSYNWPARIKSFSKTQCYFPLVLCMFCLFHVFILLKCWHLAENILLFPKVPLILWIGYKQSTRCGRVHFEHSTGSGWLSPWDPPLQWGKVRKRIYRPATHPIYFAADSPDKIHRCAAWAVFFFFTNKILCSCSIFQNLFLVVDCTTSKCYSCAWKKQNVVSALRPAFFILYLESFISRLNVILGHDLTLSVSEPDNAAAQTGAGTSFGANGDSHTWAETFYLFFAS